MDWILLLSGLFQILLSLTISVLFIIAVFKLFSRLTRGIDAIQALRENNIAAAIFNGSLVLSTIIIMKNVLDPAMTLFMRLLQNPQTQPEDFARVLGLIILYLGVSAFTALVSVYLGLRFFMYLTKDLDELGEISKNNISVGILLALVIFSIAFLIQSGVSMVLSAMMPMPEFSFFDIG